MASNTREAEPKKPEQVREVKPLAQPNRPPNRPSPAIHGQRNGLLAVQQPHSRRTSPQSSPEPKERSHQPSKPIVDANGWSTFLASVEGDVRLEVRVESFGTPTFLGDCLSFQNPDPASFATAQRVSEQDWLQNTLHRFGMVGVRVEVKIPVDHTDSKSTQQKIQGHPLIESLSRALEGEVIGVHARSENRDV